MSKPTIGVSACLIGRAVRYDGGHRRHSFVTDTLGSRARLVAVCPEVELGLGAPRPTLQLLRHEQDTRLIEAGGRDLTQGMRDYARARVEALAADDLDGYILKARSPSCAVADAPRIDEAGRSVDVGAGLFTETLMARWPDLPVEDEDRLADPMVRRDFLERVAVYGGVKALFRSAWSLGDLVRFHTAHKLALSAHDDNKYRALGRFVATAHELGRHDVPASYTAALMAAFSTPTSLATHVNVLMHALGHFRDRADEATRAHLAATIDACRAGAINLDESVGTFGKFARMCDVTYLSGQSYFAEGPLV